MTTTIESFSKNVREILLADPSPRGREKVRLLLEEIVQDKDFTNQFLKDDAGQRTIWYQDKDLGFAILGHVFKEARRTQPHDHGESWAIYGQVEGETTMDTWDIVEPAIAAKAGKVKLSSSKVLKPGQARVYNEGEIHSPRRESAAKLIRIEGNPNQSAPARVWEPIA